MRNEKSILPVFIGFLALLVAGVVFFTVLRGGFHPSLSSSSTISSDQLLAEASRARQVKVKIDTTTADTAYVVDILPSEYVASLSSCKANPNDISLNSPGVRNGARCATSVLDVYIMASKAVGLRGSMNILDGYISALYETLGKLGPVTTLAQLPAMKFIPIGKEADTTYEGANNISMACVKTGVSSSGIPSAVGTYNPTYESEKLWDNSYAQTQAQLDKLKATLQTTVEKADTSKGGSVEKAMSYSYSQKAWKVGNFIMVTHDVALKYFGQLVTTGRTIPFSITVDTSKPPCKIGGLLGLELLGAPIKGPWNVNATELTGDTAVDFCLTNGLILDSKDRINKKIRELEEKRLQYNNLAKKYDNSIKKIKKSNPQCF